MAHTVRISGERAKKGERMTGGGGWLLATTKGKKRVFRARLIVTINDGKTRLAIFRLPK